MDSLPMSMGKGSKEEVAQLRTLWNLKRALPKALEEAETWAKHGYSPESRAYWEGMRDTLRVLMGLTTEAPTGTGPGTDVAAFVILGALRK